MLRLFSSCLAGFITGGALFWRTQPTSKQSSVDNQQARQDEERYSKGAAVAEIESPPTIVVNSGAAEGNTSSNFTLPPLPADPPPLPQTPSHSTTPSASALKNKSGGGERRQFTAFNGSLKRIFTNQKSTDSGRSTPVIRIESDEQTPTAEITSLSIPGLQWMPTAPTLKGSPPSSNAGCGGNRRRRNSAASTGGLGHFSPLATALASAEEAPSVPGHINVCAQYSAQKEILIFTVVGLEGMEEPPSPNKEANSAATQIRLTLLEEKPIKHHTDFVTGYNPHFNQTFTFSRRSEEQLAGTAIRLRVYRRAKRKPTLSSAAADLIGGKQMLVGEAFFYGGCHVDTQSGGAKPSQNALQLREHLIPSVLLERDGITGGVSSSSPSITSSITPTTTSSSVTTHQSGGVTMRLGERSASPIGSQSANNLNSVAATRSHSTTQAPMFIGGHCGGSPVPQISRTAASATASRRSSMVDVDGRFCALPQSAGNPELLLSLCYLENQSKVVVGVEKANGFDSTLLQAASPHLLLSSPHHYGSPTGVKPFDTFVRVAALSADGAELSKHKSETVKASNDPVYHDTSVFEIPRSKLEQSSIMIKIFTYAGMFNRKKVQLGWICVGSAEAGHASSADAQQHWQEMIQGMGTTVDKWHNVLRPPLGITGK